VHKHLQAPPGALPRGGTAWKKGECRRPGGPCRAFVPLRTPKRTCNADSNPLGQASVTFLEPAIIANGNMQTPELQVPP